MKNFKNDKITITKEEFDKKVSKIIMQSLSDEKIKEPKLSFIVTSIMMQSLAKMKEELFGSVE